MSTAHQFIAWIFSMSGGLIGYLMAENIREELKPGYYWFLVSEKILLAAPFVISGYYFNPLTFLITATLLIIAVVFKNQWIRYSVLFTYLGVLFFTQSSGFAAACSMVFLYGIPSGVLLFCAYRTSLSFKK